MASRCGTIVPLERRRDNTTRRGKRSEEVFRIGLQIGQSPTWPTWALERITEEGRGPWTASLVDATGKSLAEVGFEIR